MAEAESPPARIEVRRAPKCGINRRTGQNPHVPTAIVEHRKRLPLRDDRPVDRPPSGCGLSGGRRLRRDRRDAHHPRGAKPELRAGPSALGPPREGGRALSWAQQTREGILGFLAKRGIDCSGLRYDDSCLTGFAISWWWEESRGRCSGRSGSTSGGPRRWAKPERADVAAADIVGHRPVLCSESHVEVGRLCVGAGPTVRHDRLRAGERPPRGSAATIISAEYLRGRYPAVDRRSFCELLCGAVCRAGDHHVGAGEILLHPGAGRSAV